MADNTIKIKTEIQIKQAEVQLATLENRMAKTAEKAAILKDKMDKMANSKIPTAEYTAITNQIEKANKKFSELLYKQEQMVREGKQGTTAFNNLDAKIEEIGNEIRYAEGELEDLVQSGKAFTLGQNSDEYKKMSGQLKDVETEMDIQNKKHDILIQKQKTLGDKYKEAGEKGKKAMKKVANEAKKTASSVSTFAKKIKTMIAAIFIYNVIRKGLNAIVSAFKEGFGNLTSNFTPIKNQVDSLNASLLTLKNSLAAAFAPIVSVCIPYIQKLVEWLTSAMNTVGQFIAAIMGRTTYTKAIKQNVKATNESAKATKKEEKAIEDATEAVEGYLSPIDEINKFKDDKKTPGIDIPDSENATGSDGVAAMFEEVPVDSKILDWLNGIKEKLAPIVEYAKELRDIFAKGFFDGLGDWQTRWNDIKEDLASIKNSLIDIWTDPAVLSSADKWVKSVAYLLGSLAGSVASIGLTIANNLIGGIEKYLAQNKDRIKQYLINMFDIWTDINNMLSEFLQSFAYIFEAFSSNNGQQLTANIIGIFSDAFMGATELVSRIAKDLINIITKPFIDNKEQFRTALEGFLGIAAQVCDTIKDAIDQTFATLNEVYDAHFRPFFESIAQGLSDIIGAILTFWNENLQPMLSEWAESFDELWNSHLQPFVNSVIEILGSIMDLLKALWENILQPFIEWIVTSILPLVLPVINQIWETVKEVFASIADIITDIVNVFKGVIDLITALINGDWQAVWDACKDIVKNVFYLIVDIISGVIKTIINIIATLFDTVVTLITAAGTIIIDAVKAILEAIVDRIINFFQWIKSKVDEGLSGVKEAWDEGWNTFASKIKEVWDDIVGTVQKAIDKILSLINSAKEKWSNLKSSVSSGASNWLFGVGSGVGSFSLNLPKFATGGVIPTGVGQHLAVVGDNRHETEVVSPLSTIKQALSEVMGTNSGSTTIKLYLDGTQVAESVVRAGRLEQMSSGNNMFLLEE